MQPSIDERLAKILELERIAKESYAAIEHDFPEAWKRLQAIEKAKAEIEAAKEELKTELVSRSDFDTHQVNGYNISISRTVKLAVANKDLVSSDFKKTEEVIDTKSAQEYMKVMKKLPAGFEDRSTYRWNWREIKNA